MRWHCALRLADEFELSFDHWARVALDLVKAVAHHFPLMALPAPHVRAGLPFALAVAAFVRAAAGLVQ